MSESVVAQGAVIVIRYEGPKGGPGMPEMLTPTSAIMGAGLGKECALITDGRFSGGSHGFVIGHVTPEASRFSVSKAITQGGVWSLMLLLPRGLINLDFKRQLYSSRFRALGIHCRFSFHLH